VRRGLRPGSELRFYEHVIARSQPKRAILQLADRSGLWPAIGGRCHPARDTGAALEAALLTIGRCERLGFVDVWVSAAECGRPRRIGVGEGFARTDGQAGGECLLAGLAERVVAVLEELA
jgi:hypothetical protein